MKTLIGLLLIVLGVVVGVYLGVWVMFIGGIVQVIDAFKATPIVGLDVALGIARILFASVVGWLSALVCWYPGCLFLK